MKKKEDIATEAQRHQLSLSNSFNSPSNKLSSSTQQLKDLSNKVVDLNQRMVEDAIKLDNTRKQLEDMEISLSEKLDGLTGRFCNGDFIWRIPHFSSLAYNLKCKNLSTYSPPFYSSRFGYKFGIRIHINFRDGQHYISLYVRMMQGENDDILSWPFEGAISFAILDYSLNNPKRHIIDHLDTHPEALAFKRPTKQSGDKSFGFTKFVPLDHIISSSGGREGNGEYLLNDVLAVRVKIVEKEWFSPINCGQFVRNGSVDSNVSRK